MCEYCEGEYPKILATGKCRYCNRDLCEKCYSEIDKTVHGLCRVKKLTSGVGAKCATGVTGVKSDVGVKPGVKPDVGVKLGVKPDVGGKPSGNRGGMGGIR